MNRDDKRIIIIAVIIAVAISSVISCIAIGLATGGSAKLKGQVMQRHHPALQELINRGVADRKDINRLNTVARGLVQDFQEREAAKAAAAKSAEPSAAAKRGFFGKKKKA